MLQSPSLKDCMKNIGIDQWLINSALFEQICLQNTNKLYQHAKWDEQKQPKYILEADIISTTEGLTDKIHRSPMTPTPVKKPSYRKSQY